MSGMYLAPDAYGEMTVWLADHPERPTALVRQGEVHPLVWLRIIDGLDEVA